MANRLISTGRPKNNATIPTLAELAEKETMNQLKVAVSKEINHCCGGWVPIPELTRELPETENELDLEATSPSVVIRWDSTTQDNASHNVQLPSSAAQSVFTPSSHSTGLRSDFESLISECYKSGVGHLKSSRFSVNFSPYDDGIIDIISQVMLPDVDAIQPGLKNEHRGIRATLDCLSASCAIKFIADR